MYVFTLVFTLVSACPFQMFLQLFLYISQSVLINKLYSHIVIFYVYNNIVIVRVSVYLHLHSSIHIYWALSTSTEINVTPKSLSSTFDSSFLFWQPHFRTFNGKVKEFLDRLTTFWLQKKLAWLPFTVISSYSTSCFV